jgi:hypothetical protein
MVKEAVGVSHILTIKCSATPVLLLLLLHHQVRGAVHA